MGSRRKSAPNRGMKNLFAKYLVQVEFHWEEVKVRGLLKSGEALEPRGFNLLVPAHTRKSRASCIRSSTPVESQS